MSALFLDEFKDQSSNSRAAQLRVDQYATMNVRLKSGSIEAITKFSAHPLPDGC